jgi:hypothetical protein
MKKSLWVVAGGSSLAQQSRFNEDIRIRINPASRRWNERERWIARAGMTGEFPRWPVMVLRLVAGIAVVQTGLLLAWYWPGALPDTNTSGVWVALADDVAHGDFYRPLHGELGTGGTRYLPVFFLLHSALIEAGLTPLAAGVLLTLASAAAFLAALRAVMRRLGVPPELATPAALLPLGTVTFQMLLLTVRGDFLAAALSLAGVAAAIGWRKSGGNGRLLTAAGFFAAAFLTKVTTVFGLGAVVAWLAWRRERRWAGRLFGASVLLIVAGLALAIWASDGRLVESFRAVASGDTNGAFALSAPRRLAEELLGDPLSCILVVAAVAGSLALRRVKQSALLAWLAGATLAVTLVIFSSPGTGKNHLIDPVALTVPVLALALTQSPAWRRAAGLAMGVFGVGVVATWLPGVPSVRAFFERYHRPELAAVEEFVARAGAGTHPMYSENPLLPVLAGERPFVADLFNLELVMRHDEARRNEMIESLRSGKFGSVVLSNWPDVFSRDVASPDDPLIAATWPELRKRGRLDAGFYAALETRYRIVLVRRPYIYLLRDDRPFAPAR